MIKGKRIPEKVVGSRIRESRLPDVDTHSPRVSRENLTTVANPSSEQSSAESGYEKSDTNGSRITSLFGEDAKVNTRKGCGKWDDSNRRCQFTCGNKLLGITMLCDSCREEGGAE